MGRLYVLALAGIVGLGAAGSPCPLGAAPTDVPQARLVVFEAHLRSG